MKLRDLRIYLQTGKLGFSERTCSRHYHYHPALDDGTVNLPTIVAVSGGSGDATLSNLKGVARALGLTLQELETSQACRIGRECVLLLLAWEMLLFCFRRQAAVSDAEVAEAGLKAMVLSVQHLIGHVQACPAKIWGPEELRAVSRILPSVRTALADPRTSPVAALLVQAIHERSE